MVTGLFISLTDNIAQMETSEVEFMIEWLDNNRGRILKGMWTTEEVLMFAKDYAQLKVNELNKCDSFPIEEWQNIYQRFQEYKKTISVKLSTFDYANWMMTEYEAPKKRGNLR